MDRLLNRRCFLQQAAVAGGATAFARNGRAAERTVPTASRPAAPTFEAYQFESQIWVRIDGRMFTCYRAGAAQKYPYFYPLIGAASGASMTEESSEPWPHHRSLFLGCDRVNGANYWQEGLDRGRIASRGPRIETKQADRVVIADHCDWTPPGKPPVIEDVRRFTLTAPDAACRLIDADITITAREDIAIAKTNHSFFSLRAARDLAPAGGGALFNSAGQEGEKATFGEKAAWCAFRGRRCGVPETIVLMDHPRNPWSPCPWFTRDYGMISPTPFYWLENGWNLPAGKSIRIRHRVAALSGDGEASVIGRLYEEFARAGDDAAPSESVH